METEILIVLSITGFTVFMLVSEIVRIDITAILTMLLLSWTGVLTTSEALSGFSSNAVIAMIGVMILGEGIAKTGMMSRFSKAVLSKVGESKNAIVGSLSLSVGSLSAVMQNIGAAALFLPSMLDISRRTKIPASALIMPIGFAAIIGGTLTMVGSGHLILTNDLLIAADLDPYGLFAVTPVGIALLAAAIFYFLFFGKWVLPQGDTGGKLEMTEQEKVIQAFELHKNIRFFQISAASSLKEKTVEESGVWNTYNVNIIASSLNNKLEYAPWRKSTLVENQVLALHGSDENIKAFTDNYNLIEVEGPKSFEGIDDPEDFGFVEVIVSPRSELIGQTIRQYGLRKRHGVEPLILFSNGEKIDGDFSDHKIAAGDTFIVYGSWKHISDLQTSDPFVIATTVEAEPKKKSKSLIAAGSFALAILLAMFGFSISIAFLTGAIVMILAGVMTMQEAYKSIEWKVVFLLVGLIPLGIAMQNTGTAQFLAEGIMYFAEGSHTIVILLTVAILSTVFSLVMSNVGAVVVLAPLVVGIGTIAGLDPRPLVLLAAVMAGNSFILPTHQVNALLMTPGGYKTSDYFKAGGGMTIVFLVVAVLFFYFSFF